MTDKHNQSFFGQSTGMFIQSSSKNEPFIFLQFIKKKGDGSWEKPSLREGKRVKCGLEEIIMILNVLKNQGFLCFFAFNFIINDFTINFETTFRIK